MQRRSCGRLGNLSGAERRAATGTAVLKVREVTAILKREGWFSLRDRGSHHHFKHKTKSGLVTVPGKPGDDIHPKTLNSILKQAGLK